MATNYVKSYRFPCNKDIFTLNSNTLILYSGGNSQLREGIPKTCSVRKEAGLIKLPIALRKTNSISMLPLRITSSSYTDPSRRNKISKPSSTFCMEVLIKQT